MCENDDPKNYRPIKYQSTTYKLITSVFTDRTYIFSRKTTFFPWISRNIGNFIYLQILTNDQQKDSGKLQAKM